LTTVAPTTGLKASVGAVVNRHQTQGEIFVRVTPINENIVAPRYLEVANAVSGSSISAQNTAPTGSSEGDMWWDSDTGELFVYYANNWVDAVGQDVTPYTNNASYTSGNTTLTFVRTDGSQYEVSLDLSNLGGGDVTNTYLTSTFTANADFQSYVANTNARFPLYLEVANANFATELYVDNAVAALVNSAPTTLNTLEELAQALGDDANYATTTATLIGTKASNTYVNTLLANTNDYIASVSSDQSQYLQVANVSGYIPANTSTTSASLSGNTVTFTRADSSTFDLDLSGLSTGGGGGSSVTVANTAPVGATEGDMYFDEDLATLYVYYDSSWIEVQSSQIPELPFNFNVDTYTANGTATTFTNNGSQVGAGAMLVTVDGIVQRPATDYTVSGSDVIFTSAPTDTSVVSIRVLSGTFTGVSNSQFQSYVANTNARFGSYVEVTSNTTMVAGDKYIVGTRSANVFLSFPSSASFGDEIRVIDGTGQANTYGIELLRNGHNIQGEAVDILIDTPRAAGGYVYYNATQGWILTEV
jgi:hypothetical protein